MQQGLQKCYLLTVVVLCFGLQGPHPKCLRKSIRHMRYSKMQRRERSMIRWDFVLWLAAAKVLLSANFLRSRAASNTCGCSCVVVQNQNHPFYLLCPSLLGNGHWLCIFCTILLSCSRHMATLFLYLCPVHACFAAKPYLSSLHNTARPCLLRCSVYCCAQACYCAFPCTACYLPALTFNIR